MLQLAFFINIFPPLYITRCPFILRHCGANTIDKPLKWELAVSNWVPLIENPDATAKLQRCLVLC